VVLNVITKSAGFSFLSDINVDRTYIVKLTASNII
jgi:hypothetical protein